MTASDVRIRVASPADADSIAAVLRGAFRDFEPRYTVAGFRATTPDAAEIRRRFVEGPAWVAERGGTVIGAVAAVSKGEDLYVRSMAVLPEARGRGAGTALLAAAEAYGVAHRCRRLVLSTTPFLTAAIHLYERAGFRRSAEGPRDLFGTPLMTMTKGLGDGARGDAARAGAVPDDAAPNRPT